MTIRQKTRRPRPWNKIQKAKARVALRHFHAIGRTLRSCEHPLRLARPAMELLELTKETGLVFPDQLEVEMEARTLNRGRKANRDERETARRRVIRMQSWLRFHDLAVINITTGQAPDLLLYRLESLMQELGEIGDRCCGCEVES